MYQGDYFTAEEPGKGHRDFESEAALIYDERRFREELRRVGPVPAGGRLLDFGSATGSFLAIAASEGWQVIGVEISAEARTLAQRRGARSVPSLADAAEMAPFSLISLHHVLEHLADPVETLKSLCGLIAEDGRILVEVPNWKSLERRSMGREWMDLRPEQHRWQFEPATLRRVCELADLRVDQLFTRGEPVPTPASVLRSLAVPERWLAVNRRRKAGNHVQSPAGSPRLGAPSTPAGARRRVVDLAAWVVDSVELRGLFGKRLVAICSLAG